MDKLACLVDVHAPSCLDLQHIHAWANHCVVTVYSHPCSSDTRGNADATASFSGRFCCAKALNLNKQSFHCCCIIINWHATPSVPSEAYDSIYFEIFQLRSDGGTSLWTVSDGHCIHNRKRDAVCLLVTKSQKVCGMAPLCSGTFVSLSGCLADM